MSTDREPSAGTEAPPAAASGDDADVRRRAALRRLGRAAAYTVPATMGLMMMTRSARAS